ncbi:hypothetical protein HG536_0C01100 [Torulaspora globosa]|uniref:Uncharacterized protein n=1 Tax=Torulaspora globosa TaxID=48254 RepID=A0A7G3ZEK7_9SACH|nr:uncharacterized protein HG536_0C01100 [Torulaspora globosa]QLL31943.1 hypothetical protein HG536_0C01100 [Torulaspora globosa]
MFVPRLSPQVAFRSTRQLVANAKLFYSTIPKDVSDCSEETRLKTELDADGPFQNSEDSISDHYQLAERAFARTRGKKRKPAKANIVVLDPKQAGLLRKRRTPGYFRRRHEQEKLSVLEGVELGVVSDRQPKSRHESALTSKSASAVRSNDIFSKIESQRNKLLVFKSSVSKEQAVRSIRYQEPMQKAVSKRRFEQLEQLLDSAYTLPQLRAYTKEYYGAANSKMTKRDIIHQIVTKYWKCVINDQMNESEDLITERIIDISTRDMYLLLLTNNGKILNNFARIGATLAVAIDENILIVRATRPIIKYVEVSLNKILSNVNTAVLPVKDIILNHTAGKVQPNKNEQELVSMVQRESAAYFEKRQTEANERDGDYNISAFGAKRISKAKKLLLWGIDYHPQLIEKVEMLSEESAESFRKFPFTNVESLDWINRNKDWYRLQQPIGKNSTKESSISHFSALLTDKKVDQWYDFLVGVNKLNETPHLMKLCTARETQKVFSLTLGQILASMNGSSETASTMFEPKVAQVASKLLELPPYDQSTSKDELFTVDQHEYYVQLKFMPDLSTVSASDTNAPPLELWFELDDYDSAITSTARCIIQQEQRALLLQTPHLPNDYRINVDTMAELIEPFEESPERWLEDQAGIKQFIQDAQLTFNTRKKLVIPNSVDVNLPSVGASGAIEKCNVRYDYVNACYHRVLRLVYKDKYMVQFSDVKAGSLGGRYTQVDFIGGEALSRDDFKQFLTDVAQSF